MSIEAVELAYSGWRRLDDDAGLIDAWRQTHYAAQAVSELAKGWGEPRDDDSHSNLEWLGDRMFGNTVGGSVRAWLEVPSLTIGLDDGESCVAFRTLAGATLAEAIEWMHEKAAEHVGEMRQPPVAPPDLPEHALGSGGAFDFSGASAFEAIAALYSNADGALRALAEIAGETEPVRIWPHHFDIATLIVVKRDPTGAMARTIGVGLTPPDGLVDDGYWYVSPWSAQPGPSMDWPDLPAGLWIKREGGPPMAALRIGDAAAFEHADDQALCVAQFLSVAINAMV